MPITPFHFGPGAALKAVAPERISFLSFVIANVLIDIEPIYYITAKQYPWHRFFHTYVGASLVSIAAVILVVVCSAISKKFFPDLLEKVFSSSIGATIFGAILGSFSHVVLDSFMHKDIRPPAPFSQDNTLLGVISLSSLHWFCVCAGVFGIVLLGLRYALKTMD